jgi:hypothetical protein
VGQTVLLESCLLSTFFLFLFSYFFAKGWSAHPIGNPYGCVRVETKSTRMVLCAHTSLFDALVQFSYALVQFSCSSIKALLRLY